MSKNAFTPDGAPHRTNRVLDVSNGLKRIGEFEAAEMLTNYATLLRERESAKAAEVVVVEEVGRIEFDSTGQLDVNWSIEGGPNGIGAGAILLVTDRKVTDDEGYGEVYVAPMPASARVPDEWVRRLSAPITPEELKRAWNMIGQAHPQKEWVERALIGFIELRLAAAPKPETEE